MAQRRDGTRLEVCKRIQRVFGDRFRQFRKSAGYMQKNIAIEMKLTRTTISNIERGTQRLYLDQVFQAAYVLKKGVHELLPTVADVYTTAVIHTPSDSPLTGKAELEVKKEISRIAESPVRSSKKSRSAPRPRK